jgi:hypothetical protein
MVAIRATGCRDDHADYYDARRIFGLHPPACHSAGRRICREPQDDRNGQEAELSRNEEHYEQVAVIDWCFHNTYRYPELDLIFAVPNGAMLGGGKVGAMRMKYLKAEGLRPGVCDLMLPVPRGIYHGAFFEIKTLTGKVSENQEQFIKSVEELGYFAPVCWGADDAINNIQYYMEIKGIDHANNRR